MARPERPLIIAGQASGLPGPEAVGLAELAERLSRLPQERARKIISRARPAPLSPAAGKSAPGPPGYASWDDFLARTSPADRRKWAAAKAKKANSERLMSGRPTERIAADDILAVLESAQGRCTHCGSLAVERRPSGQDGRPLPWEAVGRRIGSLGHLTARVFGGANTPSNVAWSYLWCNTWPQERTPGRCRSWRSLPDRYDASEPRTD